MGKLRSTSTSIYRYEKITGAPEEQEDFAILLGTFAPDKGSNYGVANTPDWASLKSLLSGKKADGAAIFLAMAEIIFPGIGKKRLEASPFYKALESVRELEDREEKARL